MMRKKKANEGEYAYQYGTPVPGTPSTRYKYPTGWTTMQKRSPCLAAVSSYANRRCVRVLLILRSFDELCVLWYFG